MSEQQAVTTKDEAPKAAQQPADTQTWSNVAVAAMMGAATGAGAYVAANAVERAIAPKENSKDDTSAGTLSLGRIMGEAAVGGVMGAAGAVAGAAARMSGKAISGAAEAATRPPKETTLPLLHLNLDDPKKDARLNSPKVGIYEEIHQAPRHLLEPKKIDLEKLLRENEKNMPKTACWLEMREMRRLSDPLDNLRLSPEDHVKLEMMRNSKAAWTPEMMQSFTDLLNKGRGDAVRPEKK